MHYPHPILGQCIKHKVLDVGLTVGGCARNEDRAKAGTRLHCDMLVAVFFEAGQKIGLSYQHWYKIEGGVCGQAFAKRDVRGTLG